MAIKIELFASPGCRRCGSAKTVVRRIVGNLGTDRLTWRAVDVLEELDYAIALGVVSTPAIAIDGELAFTGLPSASSLRRAIQERLCGTADPGA